MSDLIDDDDDTGSGGPRADGPGSVGNNPEFTVSEIAGAVKRVIEGEFGRVRVRGEVGRVSRPASGHLYFDLKDDRAVIAAVSFKGQAAKLQVRPEEGMEIVASGRLTTFPGQSKYQLVVDEVMPAGAGALMMMLEARRLKLAAEGLFDAGRKRPLPYLPTVIGVVTSPSGAVIRDILHRLRDRFPRHVLIWPVAVQGAACAPEVAAAIRGFNAIAPGGPVPRPDLIIVARGGGSLEDLWGFNEEIVVRAAAESVIPLISAVGHETDTTLIDFAADRRAPTPTAAAEMAVPVRLDLAAVLDDMAARALRGLARGQAQRRQRLADLGRGLGRPEAIAEAAGQRLDLWRDRLGQALRGQVAQRRLALTRAAGGVRASMLAARTAAARRELDRLLPVPALARSTDAARRALLDAGMRLDRGHPRTVIARSRERLDRWGGQLAQAGTLAPARARERLVAVERLRQSLGYEATLARGYAVMRAGGVPVMSREAALQAAAAGLEVQFRDGLLAVAPVFPGQGGEDGHADATPDGGRADGGLAEARHAGGPARTAGGPPAGSRAPRGSHPGRDGQGGDGQVGDGQVGDGQVGDGQVGGGKAGSGKVGGGPNDGGQGSLF